MTFPPLTRRTLSDLEKACDHAIRKHGWERTPFNPDLDRGMKLAILTEEVGEVARAMCDGTALRGELVQVAAMALSWAQSLEDEIREEAS